MKKTWILLILIAAMALTACDRQQEAPGDYTEDFAQGCAALEAYSKNGITDTNENWVTECLFHYQVQTDGHGLAIGMHPEGADASGRCYTVMYETLDGGKNWNVIKEMFTYTKGSSVFVYMGKTVVIAADLSKGYAGDIIVSHDRGRTWTDPLGLPDLIDYDPLVFPNIIPHIINYNEHSGIITFGWNQQDKKGDYLLINQFDVSACQFVEEVYRHPDFSPAA